MLGSHPDPFGRGSALHRDGRRSIAPPPTGLWWVVAALGAGPAVTYVVASGTASTCGAEAGPYNCGLGAAMGIGLIGFVFAALATIGGFARLLDDLHHAPPGSARAGGPGAGGALVVLGGIAVAGCGLAMKGPSAAVMAIVSMHLALLGAAVWLRAACVRRWAEARRSSSGGESSQDHAHEVVGEEGRIEHRPRR